MIVTNGIFRIRKSFATSNAASRVAVVIFVVPSGVSGWHCTMNIWFSLPLLKSPLQVQSQQTVNCIQFMSSTGHMHRLEMGAKSEIEWYWRTVLRAGVCAFVRGALIANVSDTFNLKCVGHAGAVRVRST